MSAAQTPSSVILFYPWLSDLWPAQAHSRRRPQLLPKPHPPHVGSGSAEDSLPDHIPRRTFLGATMISIQSTIDLRFLQIRQTQLVWHLYDGIPDIFNKLDSLRDTQAEDARRGQRAHGYLNTIEPASIQRPSAERQSSETIILGAERAARSTIRDKYDRSL